MEKGLFVIDQDLSGVNAYLFRALRDRGWDVRVYDVGFPLPLCLSAAARTVHPDVSRWRRRYHRRIQAWARSDAGFARRTGDCKEAILRHARQQDAIFTFGVAFDAKSLRLAQPHVMFRDYTAALARRSGFDDGRFPAAELDRWMAREAEACRLASVIFTASENTKQSVIRDYGVPAERVAVVGEGLCFDALPRLNDRPRNAESTILFIGKEFDRKGGDLVLAAFHEILQAVPHARLLVLGPPRPRVVPAGVQWLGLVRDRQLVKDCFAQSAVFAMPSRMEPFGLVFLEAMAHGLPCIGTAADAMPEIIEDGKTGFLVPPNDVRALTAKLLDLLQRPEEAQRMGQLGYARVRDRFQWSHVAARVEDRLLPLLRESGRPVEERPHPASVGGSDAA